MATLNSDKKLDLMEIAARNPKVDVKLAKKYERLIEKRGAQYDLKQPLEGAPLRHSRTFRSRNK